MAPSGASPVTQTFFPKKRLFLFYAFPLSCFSLPLHAEVGVKEKPRSLRLSEERSSPEWGSHSQGVKIPGCMAKLVSPALAMELQPCKVSLAFPAG